MWPCQNSMSAMQSFQQDIQGYSICGESGSPKKNKLKGVMGHDFRFPVKNYEV